MRTKYKTKDEFLKNYDKTAKIYDKERSSTFEGKQVDFLQRKLIYEIAKKNKCKKVLEAGCGTGRVLGYLAHDKSLECYGFDPSDNMLSIFKEKIKKNKLNVKLKKGDIEKIPYKDNSFDMVYTMHVLMHLPTSYKKAFEEMYRVTKKGGVVVCDFPNGNSIWTKLAIFLNPKKKRTNIYTFKELKKFFNKYENVEFTGLFSYARTFYKFPIIRHIAKFLEKNLPLPIKIRTQIIVIVKKE